MIDSIMTWLGELSGYGINPDIVGILGFCLFIFALSEFFRLFEVVISSFFQRR